MQNLLQKLSLFFLFIFSTHFMYGISPPDWVHFVSIGPTYIEVNCAPVTGALQYQFTLYSDVIAPQISISSGPTTTFPYMASDDYVIEVRVMDHGGGMSTSDPPLEIVTITTVYLDRIELLCNYEEALEVHPEFEDFDGITTNYFSTDLLTGLDISRLLTSSIIGFTDPFFEDDYYERCCICKSLHAAQLKRLGSQNYYVYDPTKMEDLCNIAFYNNQFSYNNNYYSTYLDPINNGMNTTGGANLNWEFDKIGSADPCRFVDYTSNDFYTDARLSNPNPLPETVEELLESSNQELIDAIIQVQITDMTGKQIKSISTDFIQQLTKFKNNINQDATIAGGLYLIKIESKTNSKTYKLLIAK